MRGGVFVFRSPKVRWRHALSVALLLACPGCASHGETSPQERKDYPVETWMLDQMWWVPGFMKHPRNDAD
jgi:hypothetical protein